MKRAAIDIGSNAIRLSIADGTKITKKIRIPLRLGTESFSKDQTFSQNTIDLATEVFKGIANLFKNEEITNYEIYATSAFRNARNSDQLAEAIKNKTTLKIEQISGDKEAKIILKSILNTMNLKSKKTYLLFDLGGGSIELSKIKDNKTTESKSFELGTVRLMNYIKLVNGDKELIEKKIKQTQTEILNFIGFDSYENKDLTLIGTGGNFRRLLKMRNSHFPPKKDYFTKEDFLYIQNNLKNKTYLELIKNFELRPDRADVIVPAMMIIQMVIETLPITKIYAPKVGLINGILDQMLEK
jgi:exopolyphosphatase / guanosine-5'-triphosphate,3'-diphosphate pyrophosphatase